MHVDQQLTALELEQPPEAAEAAAPASEDAKMDIDEEPIVAACLDDMLEAMGSIQKLFAFDELEADARAFLLEVKRAHTKRVSQRAQRQATVHQSSAM